MKRWACLALATIGVMSHQEARADDVCPTMVAAIMKDADGEEAKVYTNVATIRHNVLGNIRVPCQPEMSGVIIETPVAYPTNRWFYYVSAVIAAISKKDQSDIEAEIRKCHLDIRKDEKIDLEIMLGKHQLVCSGQRGTTYVQYWLTSPFLK